VTPAIHKPCLKALDAECFQAHPEWAKRALAFKLLHLFVPPWLSRKLPGLLRVPLIAPGVNVPPGYYFPPGTIIPPGAEFPPGWTPADPLPDGVFVPPDAVFPPGWTLQDPLPDAVVITPDAVFPDDWTPGDPLPDGVIVDPGTTIPDDWTPDDPLPDGITIDPDEVFPDDWTPDDPLPGGVDVITLPDPQAPTGGPLPPIYTDPFEPGPLIPPGDSSPVAAGPFYYGSTGDGYIRSWGTGWLPVRNGIVFKSRSTWRSGYGGAFVAEWWSGQARVQRSYLYIDLSTKPPGAEATAVDLVITAYINANATVCVQQGTQWTPLELVDFTAFTGDFFAYVPWALGQNVLTFNEAGIDYINSVGDGIALLCLREYEHDYLNICPGDVETYDAGMYYQNHAVELERPRLDIVW